MANAALEEWLTTFVGASTSLKKLYYETKQLKSMHGSLGLDAALGTDLPPDEILLGVFGGGDELDSRRTSVRAGVWC